MLRFHDGRIGLGTARCKSVAYAPSLHAGSKPAAKRQCTTALTRCDLYTHSRSTRLESARSSCSCASTSLLTLVGAASRASGLPLSRSGQLRWRIYSDERGMNRCKHLVSRFQMRTCDKYQVSPSDEISFICTVPTVNCSSYILTCVDDQV